MKNDEMKRSEWIARARFAHLLMTSVVTPTAVGMTAWMSVVIIAGGPLAAARSATISSTACHLAQLRNGSADSVTFGTCYGSSIEFL